jgi:hypothetical protein
MSINEEVMLALKDIGVPVRFQRYSGDAATYITFFTYLERPEGHADDQEHFTGYYVQVDIWSKKDYTVMANIVGENMAQAGFVKQSFYDLYEEELKIYHKAMRFLKEV